MEGYFELLEQNGLSHNVLHLAGHGTTQTSMRGFDPRPLDEGELKDLCALLENAMDQGAAGVSFGLGYEPGIFFPTSQIKEIARLVKKKDKIITVHGRAFTPISTIYPDRSDTPHNIISLQEMIDVSRETGVRMQYSHLIFVGEKAFPTCPRALETLDEAIAQGVDIMVDSFPYHCGQSIINVVIPPWFLADLPAHYKDPKAVEAVEESLNITGDILGFGPGDIQLTFADHPDYRDCIGLFMDEIAAKKNMSPGRVILDLSEKTRGTASILNHRYSNMEIIDALMPHPACLFMTDAIPIGSGVENPSAYGAFPLFLQYARERGRLSLEKAVHKMTGATAKRFNIRDRGLLRKGLAADITVFDWKTIRDNNTVKKTNQMPTGIKAVFINGEPVLEEGKVNSTAKAGTLLRS